MMEGYSEAKSSVAIGSLQQHHTHPITSHDTRHVARKQVTRRMPSAPLHAPAMHRSIAAHHHLRPRPLLLASLAMSQTGKREGARDL
jgi:hypothetical protein